MSIKTVLQVTNEEIERVRKHFGATAESIKSDVEILQEWKRQQSHLPKEKKEDEFIERCLIRNKFRMQQTKAKIEAYYTVRGLNRELFSNFKTIVPSQEAITVVPLPKLTPNLERLVISRIADLNPDTYDIARTCALNLIFAELCCRYDYAIKASFVIDLKGVCMGHLKKVNPHFIGRYFNVYQQAFSGRIGQVDVVNVPSFATSFLGVVKMFVPPKTFSKIKLHEDANCVQETIPKHCLPIEYGGTMKSISEIIRDWDVIFKDHASFFDENLKNISDETLRIAKTSENDMFGIDGTFKKITLD